MTNQEAINKIQYRIDTASKIVGNGEDGNAFKDLEIAIEALEKLDKIKNVIDKWSKGEYSYSQMAEGISKYYRINKNLRRLEHGRINKKSFSRTG